MVDLPDLAASLGLGRSTSRLAKAIGRLGYFEFVALQGELLRVRPAVAAVSGTRLDRLSDMARRVHDVLVDQAAAPVDQSWLGYL
jgi:hypothetical protein